MASLFDWVSSPVDSAAQQWRVMIADWYTREGDAYNLITNLQAMEGDVAAMSADDYQSLQEQIADGQAKLNHMHTLDNAADQVQAWFGSTNQSYEASLSGLGVAFAFPVAAAVAVVAASAAFAAVGYWMAQAAEYYAQTSAKVQIFNTAKANGATDAEALQDASDAVPDIPTIGAGSSITEWLMIGAAVLLIPTLMDKR